MFTLEPYIVYAFIPLSTGKRSLEHMMFEVKLSAKSPSGQEVSWKVPVDYDKATREGEGDLDIVQRLAVKHLILDLEYEVRGDREGQGVQLGSALARKSSRVISGDNTRTDADTPAAGEKETPLNSEPCPEVEKKEDVEAVVLEELPWMKELEKEASEIVLSKKKVMELATRFSIVSPYANTYFALQGPEGEQDIVRSPAF